MKSCYYEVFEANWINSLVEDVIEVNGEGTCGEYETGETFWFWCDDEMGEELLPFSGSMLESIKFFVFLFFRVDPFVPERYSNETIEFIIEHLRMIDQSYQQYS